MVFSLIIWRFIKLKKHLMKYFSFIIASFLLTLQSVAQITITAADVAKTSKTFYQAIDNNPTISVGSAGANKKWDMSMLKSEEADTMLFLTPDSTPYKASFPSANLAYKISSDTSYHYLTTSASSLMLNGSKTATIATNYYPAAISIPFPLSYNKVFKNNYTKEFKIAESNEDVLLTKSVVRKTATVDAWGNMITPQGSFNCLRIMEVTHQIDSVFIKFSGKWNFGGVASDSSKTYTWWANNIGFPLLTANVNFITDSVEQVSWLNVSNTVNVKKLASIGSINVYPNPAQNQLQFKLDAKQASTITIFDVTGKMLYATLIKGDITTINTAPLANGMYTYAITNKENSVVNRGKFTILK